VAQRKEREATEAGDAARAVGDELEDGVVAEGVVVVLVKVAGQDTLDAAADHLQEGVLGEAAVAGVVERVREGSGEPDALIELADGQQPGIAGELARGRLNDQRCAEEVEDLLPGGWYTQRLPLGLPTGPDALTG